VNDVFYSVCKVKCIIDPFAKFKVKIKLIVTLNLNSKKNLFIKEPSGNNDPNSNTPKSLDESFEMSVNRSSFAAATNLVVPREEIISHLMTEIHED